MKKLKLSCGGSGKEYDSKELFCFDCGKKYEDYDEEFYEWFSNDPLCESCFEDALTNWKQDYRIKEEN